LWAKKKKNSPAQAALEAFEALDVVDTLDISLSKKEQKDLLKKQKKEKAVAQEKEEEEDAEISKKAERLVQAHDQDQDSGDLSTEPTETAKAKDPKKLSRKEEMLMKALEMEKLDEQGVEPLEDDTTKLSKKELKALQNKEEKKAAKLQKKKAKNENAQDDINGDADAVVNGADDSSDADGSESSTGSEEEDYEVNQVTLEDKIRKERPPPRVRVMESAQPDFTSLRLENVGITFRNQEVLKDVTWGVQTGNRIGLVGANGAGKTTQLRIMAGELEPTTGDVVKSSRDLRVAMLRQEFVEELVPERTLQEEFLSVFEEENKILMDLKGNENALETTDAEDTDKMQDILDRMQELQNQAENKGVYALKSRVKKTMDLMGFTDDEGEDLVASFSGGWKMRIGLGKVLLKDPNVLLLDEPTNHLDLDSVEWLEDFLIRQNMPMIIVR
jgi:ABC-type multidrug transport system ATPase subunit